MLRKFAVWSLVASMVASPMASTVGVVSATSPLKREALLSLANMTGPLRFSRQFGPLIQIALPQLMLVNRIVITVPPDTNVQQPVLSWADAPVPGMHAEDLSEVPNSVPTDLKPGDGQGTEWAMYDEIANTSLDPREWKSTVNADGSVTYTSTNGSTITGRVENGNLVVTKKAGMVPDAPPVVAQAPPTAVATTAPASPPVPGAALVPDAATLAINQALDQYFGGMTRSIAGEWVDPNGNAVGRTVLEGLVLMQTITLQQLMQARSNATPLIGMTAVQKDNYINSLRAQAATILQRYRVFLAAQQQVENVPGSTEGIRNQYNKFMAQAAALEQQGKKQEAAALRANIAGSAYANFVRERDRFYQALAVNPLFGVQIDGTGAHYFEAMLQSTNAIDAIALFDKFVNEYVTQITAQIDRVGKLGTVAEMWELGGPMYAQTQAIAAAYGGDFTAKLIDALQGAYAGAAATGAADKAGVDLILAIGSAIPVVGLGFTVVQIYREGSDYVIALSDEKNAKAMAPANGYDAAVAASEHVDSAGNKFGLSVALLPAQIPGFLEALRVGKNIKVKVQGAFGNTATASTAATTGTAAATTAGTTVRTTGTTVRTTGTASTTATAANAAGDVKVATNAATAAADAAATKKLADFLAQQATASGIAEVQAEIKAARAAGMSDAQIAAALDGNYNPNGLATGNLMAAEELMRARLTFLGKDLSMAADEYRRIQQLSVRAGANGAGLSADDVAWLQAKLDANPNYLNNLPNRGYVTPWSQNPFFGGTMPQEGFVSALQGVDDVNALKAAFTKAGGRLPPPSTGVNAGTVILPPGSQDATVRLPAGSQAPTVRIPAGGETAPTVRIPAGGETAPTVRIPAGGETAPTVRIPAGGETAPTVRIPAGGETAPTVRIPAGGETAPTVRIPAGGETAPTVRIPAGGETAPTVRIPAGGETAPTVRIPAGGETAPTVRIPAGGETAPTVRIPAGGETAPTVRIPAGGETAPTVRIPAGGETAPTVRIPAGGETAPTVRIPAGGETAPTVRIPTGGETAPTVRLPGPTTSNPTVVFPPGSQDATVRLPAGTMDPTVRLPGPTTSAPTTILPPGSQDATVRLPPGTMDPTVRIPGPTSSTPPTVIFPPRPTSVRPPTAGIPSVSQDGTVILPPGSQDATVRLPAGSQDATVRMPANQPGSATTGTGPISSAPTTVRNVANVGLMAFGQAGTAGQAVIRLTSLGTASGEAFRVQVINNGPVPLSLNDEGIIIEPIPGSAPASTPQLQNASAATGPNVATTTVEGFCVERLSPPPPEGMQYRVAPPSVQQRFAPLAKILQAATRVQSSGLLKPDSDVQGYFDSIRQWAIWAKQDNFDQKKFTEEFLNHAKKNVESANMQWTRDMDRTIRQVAPNRWSDIQKVLEEANKPKLAPKAAAIGAPPVGAAVVGEPGDILDVVMGIAERKFRLLQAA